jgi:hypothetical protein
VELLDEKGARGAGVLYLVAFANAPTASPNPFDGPMSDQDVAALSRIPARWAQRVLARARDDSALLLAWREAASQW